MFKVYHGMQGSWVARDAQEVGVLVGRLVAAGYSNILVVLAEKEVTFNQIEGRDGEGNYRLAIRAEVQVV